MTCAGPPDAASTQVWIYQRGSDYFRVDVGLVHSSVWSRVFAGSNPATLTTYIMKERQLLSIMTTLILLDRSTGTIPYACDEEDIEKAFQTALRIADHVEMRGGNLT